MRKITLALLLTLISLAGMAQLQVINVGTSENDGTGDKPRNAMIKVKNNFNYHELRIDSLRDGVDSITGEVDSVFYGLVCSNIVDELEVGDDRSFMIAPRGFVIDEIIAGVLTPQTSGSVLTIDVKKNGSSILSTLVTIDNNESTSNTAATPYSIDDGNVEKLDKVVIDITQAGTGGYGLLVWLIGHVE